MSTESEDSRWLTARLVEDLHCAVKRGRDIGLIVDGLEGTTLPGILEYGCLRWSERSQTIPPLPQSIITSEIGKALTVVRSELGLREGGRRKGPVGNIGFRSVEFMVLDDCDKLTGREWGLYTARFARSTEKAGFDPMQGGKMQAAFHEMTENALIHSSADIPVLVGYRVLKEISQFSVVDVGIGVLASLSTCDDYHMIRLHKDAIRAALQDGSSRFGRGNGGAGFRQVFKALAAQWGRLRFRSGEGCIMMDGTACDADNGREYMPPMLPGFQVTVTCQTGNFEKAEPII